MKECGEGADVGADQWSAAKSHKFTRMLYERFGTPGTANTCARLGMGRS